MRIFEIAPNNKLEQDLAEGRMDPNVVLSLQNVVKAGKITNTFEKICMARLLEFFKNGNFYRGGTNENNFFDPFVSTSKDLLDTIAHLEAKDAVALASKLLEMCYIKDRDLLASYCNATQENIMWINWVTKREANESQRLRSAMKIFEIITSSKALNESYTVDDVVGFIYDENLDDEKDPSTSKDQWISRAIDEFYDDIGSNNVPGFDLDEDERDQICDLIRSKEKEIFNKLKKKLSGSSTSKSGWVKGKWIPLVWPSGDGKIPVAWDNKTFFNNKTGEKISYDEAIKLCKNDQFYINIVNHIFHSAHQKTKKTHR